MRGDAILRRLRLDYLTRLSVKSWVFFVIPLCFALALILSVGPELQYFSIDAIGSGPPSAENFHQNGSLTSFPSLSSWVISSLDIHFLAMSLIITLFSIRWRKVSHFITAISIASFWVLSTVDLAVYLFVFDSKLNIIHCIVSNFIGSAIILGAVGIILCLYELIVSTITRRDVAIYVGAVYLAVIGLVISILSYFCFYYLFQFMPLSVDLVLKNPIDGIVISKRVKAGQEFNLIPTGGTAEKFAIDSPDGRLSAVWRRREHGDFTARISLVAGCIGIDEKDRTDLRPWIEIDNAKSIGVLFDSGSANFNTIERGVHNLDYRVNNPTFFWLRKNSDDKKLNVSYYLQQQDRINIKKSDKLSFYMSAPLLSVRNGKVSLSGRVLDIYVNGNRRTLRFEPVSELKRGEKAKCAPTILPRELSAGGAKQHGDIRIRHVVVGVVVEISPKHALIESFERASRESSVYIKGGSGWSEVSGLDIENLHKKDIGRATAFLFRGNVADFTAGESPVTVRAQDTIYMEGSFLADYLNSGGVHITGVASGLWKGERLLNLSLWMSLSNEIRIFVLGLIGSILLFGAKLLWPLRRNLNIVAAGYLL